MTGTDTKFFTNEPGKALVDRFKKTLQDVQFFDVLVGYFQTSGFNQLYPEFEEIEEIRILVGLGIDRQAFEIIDDATYQMEYDFSFKETRELFSDTIVDEIDQTADTSEVEIGIQKFIDYLISGKIQIKAHPSHKIHAKVYISRYKEDDKEYGSVITGSSNFSYSGLVGQYEFNVELKDSYDVKYALKQFEQLWKEAVDVSEDYVETVQSRTWLNDKLQPYLLYLKTLYEYFKEDINLDQTFEAEMPEGFLELEYQKQATLSAYKILQAYNGVFLSDVVGLGKTYISALLAKLLDGKKLIICPPPLMDYWEETLRDFGVVRYKVESIGKIDQLVEKDIEKYQYIFIDEAHRFRNQQTQTYAQLAEICVGKKVILITATPFNNDIDDILSQLKLFQVPKKSLIPGVSDLDRYFKRLKRRLKVYEKSTPEYLEELGIVSSEIREEILKYVMVRRTRSEIVNFFQKDIQERGLFFPEIHKPHCLTYDLGDEIGYVFDRTIALLQRFVYSRYTPFLYLERNLTPLEEQQQKNVRAFMKILLVKRLESSFYAFKKTVGRFVESYSRFIEMFDEGTVYISKKVNVFDYLDQDREDELMRLVEQEEAIKIKSGDFEDGYRDLLENDLSFIKEIQHLWRDINDDPKLVSFIDQLKNNPYLSGNKLIIFTEAGETGEYLYSKLTGQFNEKEILYIHGGGGLYEKNSIHPGYAKQIVRENFDPMYESPKEEIRILITTDVLAEGVNLHRSNLVINYDLPWNPTRVLQRVGRVNRVGTEFKTIHIFNYFPTEKAESEIGLEDNIKAKIQAFHSLLGEDAKYLTEEEEVDSYEIFGDRLYKRLQNVDSYTGETDERSELEYLQIIREIRDETPDLFERVKRLPKKARTGKETEILEKESLVTFIRKGALKKFFISFNSDCREVTFLNAMDLIRSDENEKKIPIPRDYYDLLDVNKNAFETLLNEDDDDAKDKGGQSNLAYIIMRLKTPEIRNCQKYTEDDDEFIRSVRIALEEGRIPYKVVQRAKRQIETVIDPLALLSKLRKGIPGNFLKENKLIQEKRDLPSEIILSVYLSKVPK